jgi:hypothetical protein
MFCQFRITSLAWGALRVKVTVRSGLTTGAFNMVAAGLMGRALAVAIPEGFMVTRTSMATMSSENATKDFLFEVDMRVPPLSD